jgi:hypothetical protein
MGGVPVPWVIISSFEVHSDFSFSFWHAMFDRVRVRRGRSKSCGDEEFFKIKSCPKYFHENATSFPLFYPVVVYEIYSVEPSYWNARRACTFGSRRQIFIRWFYVYRTICNGTSKESCNFEGKRCLPFRGPFCLRMAVYGGLEASPAPRSKTETPHLTEEWCEHVR